MPEGDSLHRVARRLQVLVGERVEAESPNPRGLATGVARAVDGRVLERVEAVGKNVLLHFEGGVVVRSHLRMNGRWRVRRRGDPGWRGSPWLVLRGARVGGDAVERAGARGSEATRSARSGPTCSRRRDGSGRARRAPAPRRPVATRRRGARRPAGRRRDREHVARRGALARARLAVVAARGGRRRRALERRSRGRATQMRGGGRGAGRLARGLSPSRTRLPALRRAD